MLYNFFILLINVGEYWLGIGVVDNLMFFFYCFFNVGIKVLGW